MNRRMTLCLVAAVVLASQAVALRAQTRTPTPRPTATATPKPTPTATPKPTPKPTATATPKPTAKPGTTGKPTPSPSPRPSPKAATKPAEVLPSDDPALTVLLVDRQSVESLDQAARFVVEAMFKDAIAKIEKVRVTLEDVYNPSTNLSFKHPRAIVPVDANLRPDGVEQFFRPFWGAPIHTIEWKAGVKDGLEKIYIEGRSGKMLLKTELPWKAGKIEGIKKNYYSNGKVESTIPHVNDLAEGECSTYDEGGRLIRKTLMKGGKKHGALTEYNPATEKVTRILPYEHGRVSGLMQEFAADGKLKHEQAYKDNKKHGLEKTYGPDGTTVTNTLYWIDDDSVPEGVFKEKYK